MMHWTIIWSLLLLWIVQSSADDQRVKRKHRCRSPRQEAPLFRTFLPSHLPNFEKPFAPRRAAVQDAAPPKNFRKRLERYLSDANRVEKDEERWPREAKKTRARLKRAMGDSLSGALFGRSEKSTDSTSPSQRRSPGLKATTEIATFHPDKVLLDEETRRLAEAAFPETKSTDKLITMEEAAKMRKKSTKPVKSLGSSAYEIPLASGVGELPPHRPISQGQSVDYETRKLFIRTTESPGVMSEGTRDRRTVKKDLGKVVMTTLAPADLDG